VTQLLERVPEATATRELGEQVIEMRVDTAVAEQRSAEVEEDGSMTHSIPSSGMWHGAGAGILAHR
jgi:hypothetical protein